MHVTSGAKDAKMHVWILTIGQLTEIVGEAQWDGQRHIWRRSPSALCSCSRAATVQSPRPTPPIRREARRAAPPPPTADPGPVAIPPRTRQETTTPTVAVGPRTTPKRWAPRPTKPPKTKAAARPI